MTYLFLILSLVLIGCSTICQSDGPQRIPQYAQTITAQPEWSPIFSQEVLNYASTSKQILVSQGEFNDEAVVGMFSVSCPSRYFVLREFVETTTEEHGAWDDTLGCKVSTHEITHLMLYRQYQNSDTDHEEIEVWKISDTIAKRICVRR